jgi:DNA-binding NarL/FixJ family response regulator
VLDLSMPGIGGLETIKRLVQRNEKINILVFSVHDEQVYITRALNAFPIIWQYELTLQYWILVIFS